MPERLSDKERSLIEAARREAAAQKSRPSPVRANAVTAPAPALTEASAQASPERGGSAPIRPATATPRPGAAATPESIDQRIALLMESEREEKARRLKLHQRWKIGAIGIFVVLAGWSALTLISQIRH